MPNQSQTWAEHTFDERLVNNPSMYAHASAAADSATNLGNRGDVTTNVPRVERDEKAGAGFEPAINGFANRPLSPLGHPAGDRTMSGETSLYRRAGCCQSGSGQSRTSAGRPEFVVWRAVQVGTFLHGADDAG